MTISPLALAFGGRNFTGGSKSAPFDRCIEWNIPSLDKAYTRNGPAPNWPPGGFAGLGRTGRGGALGGGAADAGGFGRTNASVTAPWPGSPTALRAGALRPPPPPPKDEGGSAAMVGRVTPVVIPPGQAGVPACDGVAEANLFSHSIRPRSVSI